MPCQAEACTSDCDAALEVDPGRVKAYFRRALARELLGQDGDALRDARRAIEVCGASNCMLRAAEFVYFTVHPTLLLEPHGLPVSMHKLATSHFVAAGGLH